MRGSNGLGRVFADPPAESDIIGYPINGNGARSVWRAVGIVVMAACVAGAIGTVGFVAFAVGLI
ncbi:MAG: hypothetical protein F4Y86_13200 [Gammaproteobacteria bacterium]|nr:hypothetical protein [Gammaproteobacteria bacterium]